MEEKKIQPEQSVVSEDIKKGDISFEVGYGKEKAHFNLRMISVAEETELSEQFMELADIIDEAEKMKKNIEYA